MKPIINYIPIFDSNDGVNGSFVSNIYFTKYMIEIKDELGETKYNKTTEEFLNKIEIPSGKLSNGYNYFLSITIYDKNDKPFTSDPITIKTCSTPKFNLNISSPYILKTSIFNVGIEYFQEDTLADEIKKVESLNQFYITVKDENDKVVFKSNISYDTDNYTEINDLNNNSTYYVTAHGKTVNGMEISTPTVEVETDFIVTEIPAMLKVENNYKNASVDMNVSIKNVLYRLDKEQIYYDGVINLSNNTLEYYDGFSIDKDFSMLIEYSLASPKNSTIFSLNNGLVQLNFKTPDGSISTSTPYFEFIVRDNMYIIDKTSNNVWKFDYRILLSRINGEFSIKIKGM